MTPSYQTSGCGLRAYRSRAVLLCLFVIHSTCAWSHATGENYVWINLQDQHLDGRFEVRLADLRDTLGLEIPKDYDKATGAVQEAATTVQDYLRQHFSISAGGRELPVEFTDTKVLKAKGLGHFAQFHYRTRDGDAADRISIDDTLFFENDPFHRSLVLVEHNRRSGKDYGGEFTALVFSPYNSVQTLDFNDMRGLLPTLAFVWQGMLHIWTGYDHVLFLVALLIPAVLFRRNKAWLPVDSFREAFWNTVKIVTVFTIAHSITLTLASLGILQLPARLVESIIALSIILVALNNIFPVFRGSVLLIVFVFGLFHGLGFASVMGELPFRMVDLIWVIVAFNVGVELGQLAIVAVLVPLLFWLRKQAFYQRAVPVYGSAALALIAGYWFVERSLGIG